MWNNVDQDFIVLPNYIKNRLTEDAYTFHYIRAGQTVQKLPSNFPIYWHDNIIFNIQFSTFQFWKTCIGHLRKSSTYLNINLAAKHIWHKCMVYKH